MLLLSLRVQKRNRFWRRNLQMQLNSRTSLTNPMKNENRFEFQHRDKPKKKHRFTHKHRAQMQTHAS